MRKPAGSAALLDAIQNASRTAAQQARVRTTLDRINVRLRPTATNSQEERKGMVSAVVLLKTHRGLVNEVATQLAELNGISEVFSVGGRYDLVAILRVRDARGGGYEEETSNECHTDLPGTRFQQEDSVRGRAPVRDADEDGSASARGADARACA